MDERKIREILFRGKSSAPQRNNEWVYGGLLPETKDTFPIIIESCDNDDDTLYVDSWTTVDSETVGQYTGLTDMKGQRIFGGDIVAIHDHDAMVNGNYEVFYSQVNSCWSLQRDSKYHHNHFSFSDLNGFALTSEVIGNIHDNPDLLEVDHG